jgi:hypothetical protein
VLADRLEIKAARFSIKAARFSIKAARFSVKAARFSIKASRAYRDRGLVFRRLRACSSVAFASSSAPDSSSVASAPVRQSRLPLRQRAPACPSSDAGSRSVSARACAVGCSSVGAQGSLCGLSLCARESVRVRTASLSLSLSLSLSFFLSFSLSLSLSLFLSLCFCFSLFLSLSLCFCLSLPLSVSLSVCLSLSLYREKEIDREKEREQERSRSTRASARRPAQGGIRQQRSFRRAQARPARLVRARVVRVDRRADSESPGDSESPRDSESPVRVVRVVRFKVV